MKTLSRTLLASAVAIVIALPAQAGNHGDPLTARLDKQRHSIERGLESGTLTKREAGVLRDEQRDIRKSIDRLNHDRHPSDESRHNVEKQLDRAERHIHKLASNDEGRRPKH